MEKNKTHHLSFFFFLKEELAALYGNNQKCAKHKFLFFLIYAYIKLD